ncbi:MAG: hypothetical protein CW338_07315 [Clostridiales bacterium]|nr:hypothetical protein [Clostridiales bacterium]
MNKRRSLASYRMIDLTLFAAMTIVFEGIISKLNSTGLAWYSVSLAAAIVSVVYMRWGLWGMIHAVLAGFIRCVFSYNIVTGWYHYVIFMAGNLLSVPVVFITNKIGKDKVAGSRYLYLVIALCVQVLMQAGRGIISLCFGVTPGEAVAYLTCDSLSIVFTLVIMWIVHRQDGLYEDQVHYLRRVQKEEENERGESA